MEKLHYHPNTMARGLNKKRLDCIGIVFPQPNPSLVFDSYFSAILDGIIHVTTERQQNVTLYTGMEWNGRTSLPAFRDRRVDGLLLIATLTDSDIVGSLTEAGIPFVLINNTVADPRVSSVDIDNTDAVRRVVEYLVSLGHRRIGHVGGQENSPSTPPRRAGYLRGLAENGLPLQSELIVEGEYTQDWGYEGMWKLLTLPDPPTAVFAGGDGIALGIYRACAEAGVSIPSEMSVVGFDNAPFVQHLNPGLTTVHHPLIEIGAQATTVLLNALDGESSDNPRSAEQIVLPTELIVRESTAPPRQTPLRLVDAPRGYASPTGVDAGYDRIAQPVILEPAIESIGSATAVRDGIPAGLRFSSPEKTR
jgi:DNA-binding LacI/PurR family transcriptional regulator